MSHRTVSIKIEIIKKQLRRNSGVEKYNHGNEKFSRGIH